MQSKTLYSSAALLLLLCLLLSPALCQKSDKVIGGGADSRITFDEQVASNVSFSASVGGIELMPDGSMLVIDEMVRKYNRTSNTIKAVPLAFEDDPTNIFYRLKSGYKDCAGRGVVYDKPRNRLLIGCTSGILAIKNRVMYKWIVGGGNQSNGTLDTIKLSQVTAMTMSPDYNYLYVIANSGSDSSTHLLTIDMVNNVSTGFKWTGANIITSMAKCDNESPDLYYVSPSEFSFININTGVVKSKGSGGVSIYCTSEPNIFILVGTTSTYEYTFIDTPPPKIYGRYLAGTTSATTSARFGNTLFLLDNSVLKALDLNSSVITTVAQGVTGNVVDSLEYQSPVTSIIPMKNARIVAINETFVVMVSEGSIREFNVAANYTRRLATGFSLAASTTPSISMGTDDHSSVFTTDRDGNIYVMGSAAETNPMYFYAIYKFRPSNGMYYISRIAGSGEAKNTDGPQDVSSIYTSALQTSMVVISQYLYFGSTTLRQLNLQTLELTTLIQNGKVVDGTFSKASIERIKGLVASGENELIIQELEVLRRVDLQRKTISSFFAPVAIDVEFNGLALAGDALVSVTVSAMTSMMSVFYSNKYHTYVGCMLGNVCTTATSVTGLDIFGAKDDLYLADARTIYKWRIESPQAPSINLQVLNSTSIELLLTPEPSKWGATLALPKYVIRYKSLTNLEWKSMTIPFTESIVISGLNQGTTYLFCVALQNSAGKSPETCSHKVFVTNTI